MSAPENPWVLDPGEKYPNEVAIGRGLKALGYPVETAPDPYYWGAWPLWAARVYFACDDVVESVRAFAEGPQEVRDAIEAAYALGGDAASYDLIKALSREAQGELAGGCSDPEEKA